MDYFRSPSIHCDHHGLTTTDQLAIKDLLLGWREVTQLPTLNVAGTELTSKDYQGFLMHIRFMDSHSSVCIDAESPSNYFNHLWVEAAYPEPVVMPQSPYREPTVIPWQCSPDFENIDLCRPEDSEDVQRTRFRERADGTQSHG